jgi:DNA-binding transcriptional regulator YiaG
MSSFNKVFRDEVIRLARKEIRAQTEKTRKASAQHRRDLADLKRRMTALERKVAFLERQEKGRLSETPVAESEKAVRFSPKWVKADRKRLGISAADYARLVGVSALTIYNWESGKSKPRDKQRAAWAAVRGIGKREAMQRLEVLGD